LRVVVEIKYPVFFLNDRDAPTVEMGGKERFAMMENPESKPIISLDRGP
jgi:hypothetical protein